MRDVLLVETGSEGGLNVLAEFVIDVVLNDASFPDPLVPQRNQLVYTLHRLIFHKVMTPRAFIVD